MLVGGTTVTGKGRNCQRQSGDVCTSCVWLDRNIYQAWFTVGEGYRTKDRFANHSIVVAMGRIFCVNDIVRLSRKTVGSRHASVMTGSLL